MTKHCYLYSPEMKVVILKNIFYFRFDFFAFSCVTFCYIKLV